MTENLKYFKASLPDNRMTKNYYDLNLNYFKVSILVNNMIKNYYDLKFKVF